MKTLKLISAIFAILVGAAITSCGEEKSNEPENPQVDNNLTVEYTIDITPSADELKACNLSITYVDGDGKSVTEPVTGQYKKTVVYKKFPCDGGFSLNRELKPGLYDGTKAQLGITYNLRTSIKNSKGEIGGKFDAKEDYFTISADKLEALVARRPVVLSRAFTMTVDNGNVLFFVR